MIDPIKKNVLWAILLLAILSVGCNRGKHHNNKTLTVPSELMVLNYAKRFKIFESGGINLIVIQTTNAQAKDSLIYALIPTGTDLPEGVVADQVIEVPVKRLVVTSTSHIPFLDLLEASDCLVGFPNTDYISSKPMRSRIEQKLVKNIGSVNGLDFESLIELQPELIVSYISGPNRSELNQLTHSGIPVVFNLDFMEDSPLGRAEWVKFMGMLVGKYNQADSVFQEIERSYQQLATLTENTPCLVEYYTEIPGLHQEEKVLLQDLLKTPAGIIPGVIKKFPVR